MLARAARAQDTHTEEAWLKVFLVKRSPRVRTGICTFPSIPHVISCNF